jgi:outer membrane protein
MVSLAYTVQAQKIGYVNYDQLLVNAPGIKKVDQKLANFQDSLGILFRTREAELYAKYEPLLEKAQQGLLAPKDVAQIQRDYELEERKLNEFGGKIQEEIMAKRQELLLPLIQEINLAIETIAREESYDYIFDAGMGRKTYYHPEDDLEQKIMEWLREN